VTVASKGGIEAVVGAMSDHGSSAAVQERGCAALVNLAANAENKVAVAAKGGIEAVVRAMSGHGSSAAVQGYGCWALHNIAWSDSGRQSQVREVGAVPLVQKAVAAFPNNANIQKQGKGLLEKLGA
jgi:hypothetical protein